MADLTLSAVGKTYGGAVEVLKDINLDIDPVSYTHLTLPTIYSV